MIAKQADVVAALTLDVLEGIPDAYDYGIYICTCVYVIYSTLVSQEEK